MNHQLKASKSRRAADLQNFNKVAEFAKPFSAPGAVNVAKCKIENPLFENVQLIWDSIGGEQVSCSPDLADRKSPLECFQDGKQLGQSVDVLMRIEMADRYAQISSFFDLHRQFPNEGGAQAWVHRNRE